MNPHVSVIIPVFNDAEGLRETLDSLVSQKPVEGDYEILPIDNGSTDSTPQVIENFQRRSDRVTGLEESKVRTSYGARNKGLEHAEGEIICFIDADMTAPTDYLQKVSAFFRENDCDFAACEVEVYPTNSTIASRYNCVHAFRFFRVRAPTVPTCCLSVRREVIDEVGYFDERLVSGGDTEFSMRVEESRFKKGFIENVTLRHPARSRFLNLIKKKLRTGKGSAQVHHLYDGKYGAVFRRRFSPREHLLPSNPVRIFRELREKHLEATPVEIMIMALYKLPLNWAHLIAYWREGIRSSLWTQTKIKLSKFMRDKGFSKR